MKAIPKNHPIFTIALLGLIFFVLIFYNPAKGIQYGDFGLMYIQVQDIVDSGYSTFSVQYKGEKIDPEYKHFPFTKPFLGKVSEKHYIDFPPYFPLLNAPFYQLLGVNGLYLLNFISLLLTLFLIFKLGQLYGLSMPMIHLSLILYSFGMTSTMYNLVFHEYPLGIFWITLGFYFISLYYKTQKDYSLFLFGLFGAVSLFFRLEMIFVIIACGLSLLIIYPKDFLKIGIYSFLGFILPFALLLYLNFYIHGHPLGLRYTLTLTDNASPTLLGRIAIIRDMLFSNTRGFFYQSPFVLILPLALFFLKGILKKERFLFVILLVGFVSILLTSPNHGDHRAPRYLFGLYPIITLASAICLSSLLNFLTEKKSIFRIAIQILFGVLVLASFYSTLQNYKWMQRAVLNVEKFNQKLMKATGDNIPIIFRDYAQPLNAQNLYVRQMTFVVEALEAISPLLFSLQSSGIQKTIVCQLFPVDMESEARERIQAEYIKKWQLSQRGNIFYFPDEKKYVLFNWIDLGKKQNFLVLNIFL